MPLLIQKHWFTKEEIQANPDNIYVFGDNESREGNGGQAEACRGEPNTIGIRTKRDKFRNPDSYWTDETYDENIAMVRYDFIKVWLELENGKTVIFPADGFGTGRALLSQNAPKTLAMIENITNKFIDRHSALSAEVEQPTLNGNVAGSIPAVRANNEDHMA